MAGKDWPLYKLPETPLTLANGDVLSYGIRNGRARLVLRTVKVPKGEQRDAIKALQKACSVGAWPMHPPAAEGYNIHVFRAHAETMVEVHRAISGISAGNYRNAQALCAQAARKLAKAIAELREMDAAREAGEAAA